MKDEAPRNHERQALWLARLAERPPEPPPPALERTLRERFRRRHLRRAKWRRPAFLAALVAGASATAIVVSLMRRPAPPFPPGRAAEISPRASEAPAGEGLGAAVPRGRGGGDPPRARRGAGGGGPGRRAPPSFWGCGIPQTSHPRRGPQGRPPRAQRRRGCLLRLARHARAAARARPS